MDEKPKTALGTTVVIEILNPDHLPSDEVIKAHNEGRLQNFIAAYLRKTIRSKFVGRRNTNDLHHEMRCAVRQVVQQLEQLGIIDPNVNAVDVHTDDELDHFLTDGGLPDPSLVHVNVGDRKMLLRPQLGGVSLGVGRPFLAAELGPRRVQ